MFDWLNVPNGNKNILVRWYFSSINATPIQWVRICCVGCRVKNATNRMRVAAAGHAKDETMNENGFVVHFYNAQKNSDSKRSKRRSWRIKVITFIELKWPNGTIFRPIDVHCVSFAIAFSFRSFLTVTCLGLCCERKTIFHVSLVCCIWTNGAHAKR